MLNRKSSRIKTLFLMFVLLSFVFSSLAAAKYVVTCKAVIFSDSTRVKRLYGKRVHEHVLPASTAKVMTALLVMERLSLNDYITVSKTATYAQPSKIYLNPGERYRVRDLLYAALIKSANDATVVLAEAVSGSDKEFAQLMTKRAKEIGAIHTKFANSNGLPTASGTQYTTAYDMYLIFRKALQYPFFREAIKMRSHTIASRDGREIKLYSSNKILSKGWKRNIYGKTGYTHAAKACFIGTLEKGSSTLIIGVFGCTNRWDDIRHIVQNYGRISL